MVVFPFAFGTFFVDGCYIGIFPDVWNNAFRERCIEISMRVGAISLWSSLRMRGEILSGPAAFPGFNLRSCLDTQETDIVMFCIDRELSFLGSI